MTAPPEAGDQARDDGEGRAAKRSGRKGAKRISGAPYPPVERHTLGQHRKIPPVPTAPDPDDPDAHPTDHDEDDDTNEGDHDA